MKQFIPVVLLGLAAAIPAQASQIYNFSATYNATSSNVDMTDATPTFVDNAVKAGTLTGTITFDETPDPTAPPGPFTALLAPTVTFDNLILPDGTIVPEQTLLANDFFDATRNGGAGETFDGIFLTPRTDFTALPFGLYPVLNAVFEDTGALGLTANALPDSISLDVFETAFLNLTVFEVFQGDPGPRALPLEFAQFNFTEISRTGDQPTPVPLPAGLPLLLAGLSAFGLMRRKRITG